jgi:hypothetical protein
MARSELADTWRSRPDFSSETPSTEAVVRIRSRQLANRHVAESAFGQITVLNRPICFFRIFSASDFKIKQIGPIESAYLVQSLHAPHSK